MRIWVNMSPEVNGTMSQLSDGRIPRSSALRTATITPSSTITLPRWSSPT